MIGLVNLFIGETASFNLACVEMSNISLVVWGIGRMRKLCLGWLTLEAVP
jgi:hypothetical protein